MQTDGWVVVGLDNGGNKNNATVLDASGRFLVDELLESPSRVTEGPDVAVAALVLSFEDVLRRTGIARERVRAVGLDTPGPASAEGVISSRGSTNFSHPGWRNYDFRGALEERLALPVVYNNDGNAAALYAHYQLFGPLAAAARVDLRDHRHRPRRRRHREGPGHQGRGGVRRRARPRAHPDARPPRARASRCRTATAASTATPRASPRSPASRRTCCRTGSPATPSHELAKAESIAKAAKLVRAYGENGDEMALTIFEQQAKAIGRLFTIAANFTDPDAYFLGGGRRGGGAPLPRVVPRQGAREHGAQGRAGGGPSRLEMVPHLDMAGARGAAIAALERIHAR